MEYPEPIMEKLNELNKIAYDHPVNIPVQVCAKFLGISIDCLRAWLSQDRCAVGMGWQKAGKENRAFCIPTTQFYLWYTNSRMFTH